MHRADGEHKQQAQAVIDLLTTTAEVPPSVDASVETDDFAKVNDRRQPYEGNGVALLTGLWGPCVYASACTPLLYAPTWLLGLS